MHGKEEAVTENTGPRVFVHAISNPNWKGIHAVEKYEQRILVCSPRKGKVVFVFSEKPDPDFMQYRRDYLGYSGDEIMIITQGKGEHLGERLLNDRRSIGFLKSLVPKGTVIETFTAGPTEEKLAKKLGFTMIGGPEHEKLGSKSRLRQLAKQMGLKVSPGFEFAEDVNEVIEAAEQLFEAGVETVVVKGDYGASSSQNAKFTRSEGWQNNIRRFCYHIEFQAGAVEEWIDDVEISPSTHFMLNGKAIAEPGPWEQVLRGQTKIYAGAKYPAQVSDEIAEQIRSQGLKLAEGYNELGYKGPLGFDTIVRQNGDILWSDVNARQGGVTFIRNFAVEQQLLHKVVWGLDIVDDRLRYYTFKQVLKKAKALLYDYQKKEQGGVVFYNVGCLSEGKIQVIIVADNEPEANYNWRLVNKRLLERFLLA